MNLPIYSAALGAFIIVLQVLLMMQVGLYRTKGQFVGIGDDRELERRVRQHGNLAENSGAFIAVLGLLEILVGQTATLFSLCVLFAVARSLHAIGFASLAGSHGDNLQGARKLFAAARGIGAFGTAATALGAAGVIGFTLA